MADDKKKGLAALIISMKGKKPEGPEDGPEMESEESPDGDDMGLEAAAQELIDAVSAQDSAGVASALRNSFAILESSPHEEGEHIE